MQDSFEVVPIGRIRTPFETTDEAPRQGRGGAAEGTIEISPEYEEALDGYEPGESVIVVWFADRADRSLRRVDRKGGMGVFRSRSPARPNPICLTTCEVLEVDGSTLRVRGVDMLDGSPVLDLKPPLR
ncbi:MAG: tRNA (N6-threonylcarbamoyladenosine(37)-N6)-methyltransferase TrmO [Halodesulfurarchaeum sp.]